MNDFDRDTFAFLHFITYANLFEERPSTCGLKNNRKHQIPIYYTILLNLN